VTRRPLDARQDAQRLRLLQQNAWIRRQPPWLRVLGWLLLASTWPSVLLGLLAGLAGGGALLTWLLTSLLAAALYSPWVFWPEQVASFGARQLMSEARQRRLQDLPPRHPNKSM